MRNKTVNGFGTNCKKIQRTQNRTRSFELWDLLGNHNYRLGILSGISFKAFLIHLPMLYRVTGCVL